MLQKDRFTVVKLKAIQKYLARHAATRTRRFQQDISTDVSSDTSSNESTEYAEQKIQHTTSDLVETTGDVAFDSARVSYIKFKAIREKQMARQTNLFQEEPWAIPSDTASPDERTSPFQASHTKIRPQKESGFSETTSAQHNGGSFHTNAAQKHIKQKNTSPAVRSPFATSSSSIPVSKGNRVVEIHSDKSAPHPKILPKSKKQQVIYQKRMAQLKNNMIQKRAIQKRLEQNAKKATEHSVAFASNAWKSPAQKGSVAVLEQFQRIAAAVWDKIRVALIAAAKTIGSALIAFCGPVVAAIIVVLFIGIIAVVLCSPISILFADESNDPNSIPIREIVSETNQEFEDEINSLIEDHPECSDVEIFYDYPDGYTWSSYWPEILALFAVNTNLRSNSDVIVIDVAKKEQIQEIFWRMHSIEWEVDEEEIPQPAPTPDPVTSTTPDPPAPEYTYTLKITVSSQSVEKLANEMEFTSDELDMMHRMLSKEFRSYLIALCEVLHEKLPTA